MKVLVTGANGFVGKYLVKALQAKSYNILATDRSGTSQIDGVESLPLDISSQSACTEIIKNYHPDVIYHLAAIAYVPDAEKDFPKTIDTNVLGTYNLVSACKDNDNTSKFIFISTANVYGMVDSKDLPLDENSPIKINNNYSLSKLMAEDIVGMYREQTEAQAVVFRAFNHIGPEQNKDYVISNFAYQVAQIALDQKDPQMLVGNLKARRDFTDVRDIVNAYVLAAEKGAGVYNLCSGNDISIEEILNTLIEFSGKDITVETDPSRLRKNDLPVLVGSNQKARDELSWKPEIDIKQTLQDTYDFWYKELSK